MTTKSPYRYTRHADEYAVTRPMQALTAHLGLVRKVGQTWIASPRTVEQGAHLYVSEHRNRENAASALDRAYRDALAED
jgi:hypothetical protein